MTGPAPQPFNKGRLVLVFIGLATIIVGTWLVLKARPDDPDVVETAEPLPPEQPIATWLAQADAARGEAYFQGRCAACHTIAPGGPHSIGPNLHGVMGNPLASRPGYRYSEALQQHGGRWDWETANRFLRQPRSFAPMTRMTFAGVLRPQDRADVMVYMNGQGGSLAAPAR